MNSEPDLTQLDKRILDLLVETRTIKLTGLWFPPTAIAVNLDSDESYTGERCRYLHELGLLDKHADKSYYRVSEKGEAFVRSR